MEQVQMEYREMDAGKLMSLTFQMKKLRNLKEGGVKTWLM